MEQKQIEFERAKTSYRQSEMNRSERIKEIEEELKSEDQKVIETYKKMVSLCPGHEFKGFLVKQCTKCGDVRSILHLYKSTL